MSAGSPYRGLSAFDDSDVDALYFFGRERDSEIVVANLIASRLTVLYGPSGVGKSSLLLAGVARTLRALPEQPLVVVFSNWSEAPQEALAHSIAHAAGIEAAPLLETATRAQEGRDVYLILDQAEEYFTYHDGDEGFDRALARLVDGALRVNVLLSLREDSLAALDRLKGAVPNLFGNVLRLDRLDLASGRAAIVKPLERWSEVQNDAVTIEEELVVDVLDGVGAGRIELGPGGQGSTAENGRPSGIEAPYLQLVMQRLWEVERAGGSTTLRESTLEELGGAAQVVADHLERAIDALTPEKRDIAARLFVHLVTPSGMKIAHQTPDLAEFASAPEDTVRKVTRVLAERRILRHDDTGRWEIFHDVLAGAVVGWTTRYEAERAVARASVEARRRQRRLAVIALVALAGLAVMGAVAIWAFAERDNARQRAREARSHELEAHALTLLPTDSTLALALAAEAARLSPTAAAEDVLRQALLVDRLREMIPSEGPVLDVAYAPGERILTADTGGRARLHGRRQGRGGRYASVLETRHDGAVTSIAYLHGIISAGRDGVVRYAPTAGATPLTLRHDSPVVALASGLECGAARTCVVTGARRTLHVWDLASGREIGSITLPSPIQEIASIGSRRVLVRATDAVLRVVDVPGRLVVARRDARARVDSIAADAGRGTVAAGLDDGSVFVWRPAGNTIVGRFETHLRPVLAVALTRNVLVSGSADGSATVRDLTSGRVVPLPGGHGNIVRSVSLSADGRFALSASADGTAKVWDAAGGRLVSLLSGHGDALMDAAFSAGADAVVTGGRDGTARVWDSGIRSELVVVSRPPPAPPRLNAETVEGATASASGDSIRLRTPDGEVLTLRGHRDDVTSVAFDTSGSLLVSASRDHDARIWDARTGSLVHVLKGHFGAVADARFSSDGRWVVTAGPISAGLWSVRTGGLVTYLRGPASRPTAVAFGPDSRLILSHEATGDVRQYRCDVCGSVDELLALAERRFASSGWELSEEARARYFR